VRKISVCCPCVSSKISEVCVQGLKELSYLLPGASRSLQMFYFLCSWGISVLCTRSKSTIQCIIEDVNCEMCVRSLSIILCVARDFQLCVRSEYLMCCQGTSRNSARSLSAIILVLKDIPGMSTKSLYATLEPFCTRAILLCSVEYPVNVTKL